MNARQQTPEYALARTVAEARATLRATQEIIRLLTTLLQLSDEQAIALETGEWDVILGQKQTLLHEVESYNPGLLVQQSRTLTARLTEGQQTALAAELTTAVDEMRARFTLLATREHEMLQALQSQVDAVRQTLVSHRQERQASRAYKAATGTDGARFINGWQ